MPESRQVRESVVQQRQVLALLQPHCRNGGQPERLRPCAGAEGALDTSAHFDTSPAAGLMRVQWRAAAQA